MSICTNIFVEFHCLDLDQTITDYQIIKEEILGQFGAKMGKSEICGEIHSVSNYQGRLLASKWTYDFLCYCSVITVLKWAFLSSLYCFLTIDFIFSPLVGIFHLNAWCKFGCRFILSHSYMGCILRFIIWYRAYSLLVRCSFFYGQILYKTNISESVE